MDVLAPRHGPTAFPRSVASRVSVACMCIHAQDALVLFSYFKLTIKSVILGASVTSERLTLFTQDNGHNTMPVVTKLTL